MLSALQENYLRKLGRAAGLDYHRLGAPDRFIDLLRSQRYADRQPARREIDWLFGAAALTLLVAAYIKWPLRG